jgi:hypothetical protein
LPQEPPGPQKTSLSRDSYVTYISKFCRLRFINFLKLSVFIYISIQKSITYIHISIFIKKNDLNLLNISSIIQKVDFFFLNLIFFISSFHLNQSIQNLVNFAFYKIPLILLYSSLHMLALHNHSVLNLFISIYVYIYMYRNIYIIYLYI